MQWTCARQCFALRLVIPDLFIASSASNAGLSLLGKNGNTGARASFAQRLHCSIYMHRLPVADMFSTGIVSLSVGGGEASTSKCSLSVHAVQAVD